VTKRAAATLADGLAFLERHINLEATANISAGKVEHLSLDPMRALVALLGDPQTDVPFVHLTGTNGKGSTAMLITRLLVATGLSVGTYASPHVSAVNERIQGNGIPIDDDDLAELLATVELVVSTLDHSPSYFEIMTASAYRWFADLAVDAAVAEVGIFGRYDATNVADGRVAVITNVGFDHTDGHEGWRTDIAEEKAGIIKPGSTLVLGETATELRPIFLGEGADDVLVRGEDFGCHDDRLAVGGRVVGIHTNRSRFDDVFMSLHGGHQSRNAALAVAATEAFLDAALSQEVVEEAFADASLPGRFEVLGHGPLVVVDGAHNVDALTAAVRTMTEDFANNGRRILIVGIMRGRDPVTLLEAVEAQSADLVLACRPPSPRGLPADELAAAGRAIGVRIEAAGEPEEAIERALLLADDRDAIFAFGSLYVAGAIRDTILG